MEPATAREVVNSSGGVTVVGSDATSDFHLASRSENPNPSPGSAPLQSAAQPQPPANAAAPAMPVKKKRGRPRKYGPDGSARPLSPMPISSAAPLPVIDFSSDKRQKVKPATSVSKTIKYEMENLGEWVACSVGANFTPHIFTVNSGEDVTMKIISFSQQGPRAICVLSANGVISSVTLRQPDSSGGTLTYEVSAIVFPTDPFTVEFTMLAALGRFEILSLSGSFMPNESGGTRSRTGGMSVSLASPDGRIVGGGVAGLLVAASPVQVVIGSFLAGNQHEQKPKKQKQDFISTATPTSAVPISSADPRSNPSPSPFQGDNWSSLPSDSRNKPTDINASVPGVLT